MNTKLFSMEQTIFEQKVEISHLRHIMNQKDKEIHVLKKPYPNMKNRIKIVTVVFLQNPDASNDNNASEREIRKINVKQKVSECFRTEQGANTCINVHPVTETAKRNGNSKYKAILAVLEQ